MINLILHCLHLIPQSDRMERPHTSKAHCADLTSIYYIFPMPFFTKSNLEDLRAEADQLSICVEHFLYASERVLEGDYKTKGFYDNCIEKCNGRLKAIHFLMESIRQNRPVSEEELEETLPAFLDGRKDAR